MCNLKQKEKPKENEKKSISITFKERLEEYKRKWKKMASLEAIPLEKVVLD